MPVSKPRGPAPARDSQRRRRNKPESHGEAEVEIGEAAAERPELGFDAHELIRSLWNVLEGSVEARYYSDADWHRVRLELFYGNTILVSGRIGAQAWAAFQSGLSELLISPADKRRAGIEMKPKTSDPDEDAAVAQLDDYRAALQSG